MLAFSRLTSILLFVLSLSFMACAASDSIPEALSVRSNDVGPAMLKIVADLQLDLDVQAKACADVKNSIEAEALVAIVIKQCTVATKAVAELGATADVSAEIKAKIAAELALIIQAIVNICVSLVAKLGATIALSLCVQLDAIVKALLVTVDACITGVIALCVKLLVDIDAKALLKLNLDLCAQVLGLVKANVAGVLGVAL